MYFVDEQFDGKVLWDRGIHTERYRGYAESMIKEVVEGSYDWRIFEKPIIPIYKASGAQILIESLGESRNVLYC